MSVYPIAELPRPRKAGSLWMTGEVGFIVVALGNRFEAYEIALSIKCEDILKGFTSLGEGLGRPREGRNVR